MFVFAFFSPDPFFGSALSGKLSIEAVPKLQFWDSNLGFNRKSGL
jgi:hypothetical protein